MPKQSRRDRAYSAARRAFRAATALLLAQHNVDDQPLLDLSDPNPITLTFLGVSRNLNRIKNTRYFENRVHRKSSIEEAVFEDDLRVCEDGSHWLNDAEFKRKYRVSREVLDKITAAIEHNDVFKKGKRGPHQMPVKHQLMTLLQFLGKEGESNASQRSVFKTSYGRNEKNRKRVVKALSSIRNDYICWPDENERKAIAARIEKEFFLPNCIGMMDGTLLPLGIAPSSDDKADYHGRKFPYSLTVLVINDDKRIIRAYLSGYPGSTHDNRLWRNMTQNQRSENFFGESEYVMSDTAFEPSGICVPAYKCEEGFLQDPDKEKFNRCLSSPRVITEHTMGLWKGRFPWLRNIRMRITNDKKSLARILRYIDATIVLHNMIIMFGEEDSEDDPWNVNDETLSDIDDATRMPERDVLDLPLPVGALPGTRREQLKNYVREHFVPSFNYRRRNSISSSGSSNSDGSY